MSDEVKKRVPKRRGGPPSPEVKRERFARMYDSVAAVYEGLGLPAAQMMRENRDVLLSSPELLAHLESLKPGASEEESRAWGERAGQIVNALLPKPEPLVLEPVPPADSPYYRACGGCGKDFDLHAPGLRLEEGEDTYIFNVTNLNGFELHCIPCTLALCKRVVIESERTGVTKE